MRSASDALAAGVLALVVAACGGSASAPAHVGEPASPPASSGPPAGRVVQVGHSPEGIAVDPATGLVAVATRSPNAIDLLDPDGGSLRTIALPASARHLRFAAEPGLLLAPLEGAGVLATIDVRTGTVVNQVALQRQPHDVATVSGRAFVSNLGGAVLVFTVRPRPVQVATVAAPGQPYGIAVDPSGQRLWVTETATDRLAEYDLSGDTPRLVATYATVRQPSSVAVGGGRVYLTGAAGGEVQVLQV